MHHNSYCLIFEQMDSHKITAKVVESHSSRTFECLCLLYYDVILYYDVFEYYTGAK